MRAGELFDSLDAPTRGLIIQHGEGKVIVEKLCAVAKEFNAKAYYDLLKKAQRYSVNVFPAAWETLCTENAIYEIQAEGIFYLDERYYSEEFGLSTESVEKLSCAII